MQMKIGITQDEAFKKLMLQPFSELKKYKEQFNQVHESLEPVEEYLKEKYGFNVRVGVSKIRINLYFFDLNEDLENKPYSTLDECVSFFDDLEKELGAKTGFEKRYIGNEEPDSIYNEHCLGFW